MRIDRARRVAHEGDDDWYGPRAYILRDDEIAIGWIWLDVVRFASPYTGTELKDVLVIQSVEIAHERRGSMRPILAVVKFLEREARRLTDLGLITGVIFSPARPSVLRFAFRNFDPVRIGEPYWFYIPTSP